MAAGNRWTEFTAYSTVISADFLNKVQDEIIDKCVTIESKTFTSAQQAIARTNIGAASEDDIEEAVEEVKVLVVSVASFSTLPQTISNAEITADHVVVNSVLGTPSAQLSDWTITTSAGSITIAGTISGSTTLTLYLVPQQS